MSQAALILLFLREKEPSPKKNAHVNVGTFSKWWLVFGVSAPYIRIIDLWPDNRAVTPWHARRTFRRSPKLRRTRARVVLAARPMRSRALMHKLKEYCHDDRHR